MIVAWSHSRALQSVFDTCETHRIVIPRPACAAAVPDCDLSLHMLAKRPEKFKQTSMYSLVSDEFFCILRSEHRHVWRKRSQYQVLGLSTDISTW
jgi:hypothetical protein